MGKKIRITIELESEDENTVQKFTKLVKTLLEESGRKPENKTGIETSTEVTEMETVSLKEEEKTTVDLTNNRLQKMMMVYATDNWMELPISALNLIYKDIPSHERHVFSVFMNTMEKNWGNWIRQPDGSIKRTGKIDYLGELCAMSRQDFEDQASRCRLIGNRTIDFAPKLLGLAGLSFDNEEARRWLQNRE